MRRVDDAVAVDIGVAASDGPLVVPICGAVIASYALPWLAFDGCQSTAREDPRSIDREMLASVRRAIPSRHQSQMRAPKRVCECENIVRLKNAKKNPKRRKVCSLGGLAPPETPL